MKISLVVPVFNEEEAIPLFYSAVRSELVTAEYVIEIMFVDDGSMDRSSDVISGIMARDELVNCISFTRNFGKEPALFAGLDHATGDAVIPIDVDLQDPIAVIPLLIEKWQEGFDVVLAKRNDRSTDGKMKRSSAALFYRLHNKISSPKIEEDVGDFRLLDRQIVETIKLLPERNLFMKGILSWVGGKTAVVEYRREPRSSGHTKFNGWRLWNLALEGLTSFSTVPLRMWTYIGLTVSALSFVFGTWMIIDKLLWGNDVPGYPSLFTAVLFFGGIQLIGIGVLGEYVGRIYTESKRRPRYVIRRKRR